MNKKIEGIFAVISALLVLFTAMLEPVVSVIIAVCIMIIYAVYAFLRK